MDERTLAALRGSIQKWRDIVAGTGEDNGVDNCSLCEAFEYSGCYDCPVRNRTGLPGCAESPYDTWNRFFEWGQFPRIADSEEKKAAAQAELEFLISLLPEGEQP